MTSKLKLSDTILNTLPFAGELKDWCKKYPEFGKALKVVNSKRFLHLGAVVISYSPNYPRDEVIGVYAYDYKLNKPIFKQDFIVNKNKSYKEFVLYTRNPGGSSKWVKDINEFFYTYGQGGYYVNSHHLNLEELPIEIQGRASEAIRLGERMKNSIIIEPKQKHLKKINRQIREVKKKKWIEKKKLSVRHVH